MHLEIGSTPLKWNQWRSQKDTVISMLLITLLSLPSDVHGTIEWYVGSNGTTETDCGYSRLNPCLNIHHLLTRLGTTNQPDAIYILASEEYQEHCMIQPVQTEVYIVGEKGEVRIGCSANEGEAINDNVIFMFKGQNLSQADRAQKPAIKIENITFTHGFITGIFAAIQIENCRFMLATVHLGDLYPFWPTLRPGDEYNMFCPIRMNHWAHMLVINTIWDVIVHESLSTIHFSTFDLSIVVCARTSYVNMTNSNIGNRRLYIHGDIYERILLFFTRNIAEGSSVNEAGIGGISISDSGPTSIVEIQNCIFQNLLSNNFVYAAVLGTLYEPFSVPFQGDFGYNAKISIKDTTFISNNGAINIFGRETKISSNLSIANCTFVKNHSPFQGGALSSQSMNICILNSSFIKNTVGRAAMLPMQKMANVSIKTGALGVNVSFFNGKFAIPTPYSEQAIISGDGGALWVAKGAVTISNCVFINNSAKGYGGAIRVDEGSFVLTNSVLEGHQMYDNAGGLLIYSSRSTILIMYSKLKGFTGVSLVQLGIAIIEDVIIQCLGNNRLVNQNVTFDDGVYFELMLKCIPCENAYTFENSSIFIHNSTNIKTRQVTCHDCPYGAVCKQKYPRVKPNYWGVMKDGRLFMARCPPSYCCSGKFGETCSLDDVCMSNRVGILCGECREGFSEALFSTKCVQNDKCMGSWVLVVVVLCCLLYAVFLLFQHDFLEAVFSKEPFPIHYLAFEKHFARCSTVSGSKERGDFIILLFYYFQDVSLISIPSPHHMPPPKAIRQFQSMFASLLEFRIELFTMTAGEVCVFPGLTAQGKVLFKATFAPLLLFTLLLFYGIGKVMLYQKKSLGLKIVNRALYALVVAMLFGYQMAAVSTFSLLLCVPLWNQHVLFINANVPCYQPWQLVLICYACVFICPFFAVIMFGPALLKSRRISHREFSFACFVPLPFLISWIVRFKYWKHMKEGDSMSLEADAIYSVLQSSFRSLKPISSLPSLCWAGILLIFRLLLVIAKTFIEAGLLRQLFMTLIILCSLMLQLNVQPNNSTRANIAETFSSFALLVVAIINVVRAAFLQIEYNPTGPEYDHTYGALDSVEDVFLTWLPFCGLSILALFIIARLVNQVQTCKFCTSKKSKVSSIG